MQAYFLHHDLYSYACRIYNISMMKSSYRIGTIWGIPINIHISLFLLLGYISLHAFLAGLFAHGIGVAILALFAAVLLQACLFASIGLHELGHSYVAIRKGCKVRKITLLIMGGAAMMESIPRKPKDEFQMAIAGPAVSATLAMLFGTLAYFVRLDQETLWAWFGVFFYVLAISNGLLTAFNLLPAFPMDGGRIARAILSMRLGRLRATRMAMLLGRAFAVLFGFVGFLAMMSHFERVMPFHGLVLVIIAGFVYVMGNREYQQVQLETLLEQRGFAPLGGSPNPQEYQDIPPDDETVLISPPPYRRGPSNYAHIEKEAHNRFSFFR